MTPAVLECLFRRMPRLPAQELAQALEGPLGPVQWGWEGDILALAFMEHPVRVRGREVPVTLLLRPEELERCSVDYEEPLSQSWAWPEAEEAIQGCEGAVVLTDPLAPHLSPPMRVAFLGAALRALAQVMEPLAIHGCDAGVLIDPEALVDDPDPLTGLVAVRRFRINDADDGELLDTLGFSAYDLPDLEMRAPEGATSRSIAHLQRLSRLLLEEGRLDPTVLAGWVQQPGRSSVAPHRTVLRFRQG